MATRIGHRFFLVTCSLLLAIGLLFPLAAYPQSQTTGPILSLDEYWQRVQEARTLVGELADRSPEIQRELLGEAAAQWQQVTAVVLPDGTQVPIDHAFLVAQLRADPPTPDRLLALLDTLLEIRDTWPRAEWSAGDLAALDQVLSRPEFQWQTQEPSALAQWWEDVQEWVWDLLGRLFPESGAAVSLLRYALTFLGIAALGTALYFALRGALSGLVADKELSAEGEGEENLTAASALKRAELLAGGGDYRTAVRYLYLSTLLLLEENGLLRYDRSLTNREYLRSVAGRPELASVLRQIIEVFERVWYGYQPLDEAAYQQYAGWVEKTRILPRM